MKQFENQQKPRNT